MSKQSNMYVTRFSLEFSLTRNQLKEQKRSGFLKRNVLRRRRIEDTKLLRNRKPKIMKGVEFIDYSLGGYKTQRVAQKGSDNDFDGTTIL